MQLIAYHLTNYRQNPAYHLPPSLVPTMLQRTVPHDHLIDGVVFSSLRDQMIVMRDQFDLGSALHLLFTNYNIHGEDVLSPDAWEISEEWLRAFPMLAHEALISSTNKWRLQRGLAPLVLEEIRDGVGGSH
ncbi:hypothetical protein BDY24DRAFT_404702 [Mrakia frigida]|uniref:uncharacterized protein n=1 Tax=Mrakia frigida TaxID=29902 RepID=UPI003FCBEF67